LINLKKINKLKVIKPIILLKLKIVKIKLK